MGRKKKEQSDKKKAVTVSRYLTDNEIENKGGKEAVLTKLNEGIKKIKL